MAETVTQQQSLATDAFAPPAFGVTDVLLFLMAVIWGVNFVVVKYATEVFSPVAFTGLRVGTVAIFLLTVALATRRKPLARRDVIGLMLMGVLGNGLYQLFFVNGVARTRAGNAALIVAAAPAFIALVARVRGMEKLKTISLLGIALSITGVALVIIGSATSSAGETTLLGSVLVFLAVICWTFYTIGLQPYTERIDIIQLSAATMVGGAIPLIIASTPALVATNWSAIGVGGWLALLYSSVISMGVAYFFWYRGLRVLGPTRTAVYSNLQPLVALLVAWAFLSETPTIFQGVGAATIVAGVFLTRA
ncbi:MAG TPA: EamA family transporter [Gemmatimonadaceae bacterium]|jgi:drug/metabolite transporter (DMT)-like permease|nr:EamA family transporter [Gemmatimonadaceae bacterium]